MSGTYRIELDGVGERESELFADALDVLVSPMSDPRYLNSRYDVTVTGIRAASRFASGGGLNNAAVYHAVPAALGENRRRADAFARAWTMWVSETEPVYTRNPEEAGLLTAHTGISRTGATTAIRTRWT